MADKITEGTTLAVGLEYSDAQTTKTTYLKIPNPRNGLTEQQIKNATLALIGGESPVVFDILGNRFDSDTAIATAYTEYEKKTEIDIGLE